ncbi:MAG: MaoC/PaaZ C-terminal domain-containing protein [Dehalococcoidales bacterium]|nr:MaoC/PaaZ C-terminal domain-containing protein [Dehalococcoidales bacterium]
MGNQLYYEDIVPCTNITPLVKHPDTTGLVMWAGASGDYNPIHYDKDYALAHGLPGVIVHGQLAACFLGQMITDWIGKEGILKEFSINYRGMNFPGEAITCRGTVTRKYIENDKHLVALKIWAENAKEEKTLSGTAVVILPARN